MIEIPLPQFPAPEYGKNKMGFVPQTTADFFTEVREPPIRSSPLNTLQECKRKFLYAYRLGIQPRTIDGPLDMGTIVHTILRELYLGRSEEKALEATEAHLASNIQKLSEWGGPAGILPDGSDVKSGLRKLEENYHKARAMAICFHRFKPFPSDLWEVLRDPEGNPMVERILTANVPGFPEIRTPCDLALVCKKTGEVWIVDFKTSSWDPKIRAIPTKISRQLALYRLVLQSTLDAWGYKKKVAGSIHAIIKKPSIKFCPDGKDKAGFHSYIDRLIKWYKDAEEEDPLNPPLARDFNNFRGPLFSRELFAALEDYQEYATVPPDPDVFYKAGEGACLKYRKPCPYTVMCNSDPVMWPDLVRSRFDIKWREDTETPDPED